jgi:hypothetical protein
MAAEGVGVGTFVKTVAVGDRNVLERSVIEEWRVDPACTGVDADAK